MRRHLRAAQGWAQRSMLIPRSGQFNAQLFRRTLAFGIKAFEAARQSRFPLLPERFAEREMNFVRELPERG